MVRLRLQAPIPLQVSDCFAGRLVTSIAANRTKSPPWSRAPVPPTARDPTPRRKSAAPPSDAAVPKIYAYPLARPTSYGVASQGRGAESRAASASLARSPEHDQSNIDFPELCHIAIPLDELASKQKGARGQPLLGQRARAGRERRIRRSIAGSAPPRTEPNIRLRH